MLKLLDLVQLIHTNQLKQLPVYDFKNSATLYGQLYTKLSANEYNTEDELAKELHYQGKKDAAYRNMKHRFKTHLLNTLFLVDFKKQDIGPYGQKYLELQRLLAQMEICLSLSKRNIGKECLIKAFKLADELDSPLAKLQIGIKQYSVLKYPILDMAAFELILVQFKYEIQLNDVYHRSIVKGVLDSQAYELLERISISHLAMRGKILYYIIFSQSLVHELNYEKALKTAAEGMQTLQQYQYYPITSFTTLCNIQIVCAIQLKLYDLAGELLASLKKNAALSPLNTLKVLEYKLILSFHTREYQAAYDAYDVFKVDNHVRKSPDLFSKKYTEYYELLRAYFLIFKNAGTINPKKRDVTIGPARINRFLNSMEVLLKHQNPLNVQVYIVAICLMVQEKRYDEATAKINAFERFVAAHLDSNEYKRILCFSQLLKELSKCAFNKAYFTEKINELHATLKKDTLRHSALAVAVEYVPYHDLWDMLIEKLR